MLSRWFEEASEAQSSRGTRPQTRPRGEASTDTQSLHSDMLYVRKAVCYHGNVIMPLFVIVFYAVFVYFVVGYLYFKSSSRHRHCK